MRIIFRRVPKRSGSGWWKTSSDGRTRWRYYESESRRSRRDPRALPVSYDMSKANFLDWSKKKSDIDFPLSQFSLADADADDNGAPMRSRSSSGLQGEFTYRIKLTLPAKYTAHAPLPFAMKRDYGEYAASYKLEDSLHGGTHDDHARTGTAGNAGERIPVVPARGAFRPWPASRRRKQRGRIAGAPRI